MFTTSSQVAGTERSNAVRAPSEPALSRRARLTFKGNLKETRYGWLRLTPAYSLHLVNDLLERSWRDGDVVLDPFCGTGTTALACAERGIVCDTTDVNPFLLWLAKAKTQRYSRIDLELLADVASRVTQAIRQSARKTPWVPPIYKIEKWWPPATLAALGQAMGAIESTKVAGAAATTDLLQMAFCRTLIERANVSFGHQSMSFKQPVEPPGDAVQRALVAAAWEEAVASIAESAKSAILVPPSPIYCDARNLRTRLERNRYGLVISSPPYCNRVSYVRELRPYMYWLRFLATGQDAGEYDWQAIGGTWGCATSRVAKWEPSELVAIPYARFGSIVRQIEAHSPLMSRYVTKYFHDMMAHAESLFDVVATGGTVHYVVGNSRFFDVLLPVEEIYAAMFESVGFTDVAIETIRPRTSKKELFEFVVSARKVTCT
jgi:hypothetical protein